MGERFDQAAVDAITLPLQQQRATRPRLGPGDRAAVLVVDLQLTFTEAYGADADAAMTATAALLAAARAATVPVTYSVMAFADLGAANVRWRTLFDLTSFLPGAPGAEIDPRVAPADGDYIARKPHASSFHGTGLHEHLQQLGVDTLYVTGASTSGCIRATAIESDARGYRTIVVADCVYDPRPVSREVSLADLADRYADVVTLADALGQLSQPADASS